MSDRQKLLASTLALVHLFAFFLAPWLHVHPEEDHSHVAGHVGHAHLSAIAGEGHHHHDDVSHNHHGPIASWQDHEHSMPPLPVAIPVYNSVSKFRFNISFQCDTFAYALGILPQQPTSIPFQFKFPPNDETSIPILSSFILSAADLPPPVVSFSYFQIL